MPPIPLDTMPIDTIPIDKTWARKQAFLEKVKRLFEHELPFNRVLGIRVVSLGADTALIDFSNRDDLIGNIFHKTLHGGVISGVLDTVGGLAAMASLVDRLSGLPDEKLLPIFSRVGTIDIRVDYLRPGKGAHFAASAWVMRSGRKVAVVRMELRTDTDVLVAVGTGTYLVG
ncbi:thioesterase family protein [Desulfosarcina sp. OttesenSCG-928-B08]|nr:thioesterase family protein [Desulfosarcina sp. OttesenSCG-928-B08]